MEKCWQNHGVTLQQNRYGEMLAEPQRDLTAEQVWRNVGRTTAWPYSRTGMEKCWQNHSVTLQQNRYGEMLAEPQRDLTAEQVWRNVGRTTA